MADRGRLTGHAVLRTKRAVEAFEARPQNVGVRPSHAPTPGAAQTMPVRVTSATPTSDRYPGKLQTYDATAKTWSDGGDCWVVGPNGESLSATRYPCRFLGILAADGLGVFVASGVPGAGVFTAQEADGTPSSTTAVHFPNTSLDTSGSAVVVRSADATHIGLVNLSAQTMGDGNKAFQDKVLIPSEPSLGSCKLCVSPDAVVFDETNARTAYITQTAASAASPNGGSAAFTLLAVRADGTNTMQGTMTVQEASGTSELRILWSQSGGGGANDHNFVIDTNGAHLDTSLEIDGDLNHDGSNVGFYGTAPAAKPTVTGSRGGNAALASLLTALATVGLITDSSSA